jgi:hypothetical protein
MWPDGGDRRNPSQQLLASVSEGVQRLQQHLKSHPLVQHPLHATTVAFPKQPISQRTREASSQKPQVIVEDEGVMVALQVCKPSSLSTLWELDGAFRDSNANM